jgi:three-Cys-motif partner protein
MAEARDGLRARDNGPWGREKLSFLEEYCPPALRATQTKVQRYYIDLFAGPGINIDRETGREFDGSPLRILRMGATGGDAPHFTHAIFINKYLGDHEALEERVGRAVDGGRSLIPRDHIRVLRDDANRVIGPLLEHIHRLAYVLVFADNENLKQLPCETVLALRHLGHKSIDLYMLFPLDMAMRRLLCYRNYRDPKWEMALTRFFGTDAWKELAAQRVTSAQARKLDAALIDLYITQLKGRWQYAGSAKDVRMKGKRFLYRMLFASNHEAGDRIYRWARSGQQELFD